MVEGAEEAEEEEGKEESVNDEPFGEVHFLLEDFFSAADLFVVARDVEGTVADRAVLDEVEVAGETDEQPGEAVVDLHVVVGVDTKDTEKVVDQFVAALPDTLLVEGYSILSGWSEEDRSSTRAL